MTDQEKIKAVFDEVGIKSIIEGNKIVIDMFEIDGQTNEVTIAFDENGKYHEFKIYPYD